MFETYLKLMERGGNFENYAQRGISNFITEDADSASNRTLKKVLLTRMQEKF